MCWLSEHGYSLCQHEVAFCSVHSNDSNVEAQNGIHRTCGTPIIQKALLHTTFGLCTTVENDPLTTAVVIEASQPHNVTSCTVEQSMSVFVVEIFLCEFMSLYDV